MATINIKTTFGEEIECVEYHGIVGNSAKVTGISLYKNGERLGLIVDTVLPNDKYEMKNFINEVETWLIDNQY